MKREAGVTHEQLQDRLARYDRGDEVQIALSVNDERQSQTSASIRRLHDKECRNGKSEDVRTRAFDRGC